METMQKLKFQSLATGAAAALLIAATPLTSFAQAPSGCANCGVVSSVKAYSAKPRHSTIGMIGGGVVGALVGNSIGDGNALATGAGAVGGAYVGNKVGQRVQTKTHYKVTVRMDNGGTRTVTYASRPNVVAGSHVRVENGRLIHAA